MDYSSLAASIPVTLMAENRAWGDELRNTIEKAQYRVLEGLHPDALRQQHEGTVALVMLNPDDPEDLTVIEGTIDLTAVAQFAEITSLRLLGESRLRVLLPRSYDFCTALYSTSNFGATSELPKYYAEKVPGVYTVFPIPGSNYEFHAIANLRCPLITPDGPSTNLLTDEYARLLEAAACIEGSIWMKDNTAVQIWGAVYAERLQLTNDSIRRRRRDETTVVTRSTENAAGAP